MPAPAATRWPALFYTGGTTGKSKGVMLSHNNLVPNAMNMIVGVHYDQDMTYLQFAPMFHLADGSATFGVTTCGGRHVLCRASIQSTACRPWSRRRSRTVRCANHDRHAGQSPQGGPIRSFDLKYIQYGASQMPEGLLRKALAVFPNCQFFTATA